MTDPKQKLEARIAQVNQHWKDQRPYELFKRLMAQPVIGEAICALGDTIIDELTDRRRELVACARAPCGRTPTCGAVTARSPGTSG